MNEAKILYQRNPSQVPARDTSNKDSSDPSSSYLLFDLRLTLKVLCVLQKTYSTYHNLTYTASLPNESSPSPGCKDRPMSAVASYTGGVELKFSCQNLSTNPESMKTRHISMDQNWYLVMGTYCQLALRLAKDNNLEGSPVPSRVPSRRLLSMYFWWGTDNSVRLAWLFFKVDTIN